MTGTEEFGSGSAVPDPFVPGQYAPGPCVAGPFGPETLPEDGETVELLLDGASLRWTDLARLLAARRVRIRLDAVARRRMVRSRRGALEALEKDPELRVYGWNQALGPLKDRPLTEEDQRRFQLNVLRSHAAGVGKHLPAAVARLSLILRANTLARGTCGARPELVDRILAIVNAGLTPLMPEVGSLGTGDLQPMAAAGLTLLGEDLPMLDAEGRETAAPEALAEAGLEREFGIETGEAIALISGSAVFSACLIHAVNRIEGQMETFLGAFALFCEASRAEKQAFDPRLHQERRIPAETRTNDRILDLIGDSRWMSAEGRRRVGEVLPRIQDATSVRSVPHQAANVVQEIERTKEELVWEANASTCNPMVLPAVSGGYEFLTGGNWDCSVLGHAAQSLNICITRLAVLTKDLAGRLGAENWSYGLPPSLSGGQIGLNSGMTLVHTAGAAVIPEMQVRANPVGTLSFPLKGGQEDNNTMAMAAVRNLESNIGRFDVVLAVLLILSAQGIDLLKDQMEGLPLAAGARRVHAAVREVVAPLGEDRRLSPEMEAMIDAVRQGIICRALPPRGQGYAAPGSTLP